MVLDPAPQPPINPSGPAEPTTPNASAQKNWTNLAHQSVQFLPGVGPKRAQLLARLGLHTLSDLLWCEPRDFFDLKADSLVRELQENQMTRVAGQLRFVQQRLTKSYVSVIDVELVDPDNQVLTVTWFRRPDIIDQLQPKHWYRVTGKPKRVDGFWKMTNPRLDVLDQPPGTNSNSDADSDDHDPLENTEDLNANSSPSAQEGPPEDRLSPVYSLTEGLRVEVLRRATWAALRQIKDVLPEILPTAFRQKKSFLSRYDALESFHFPADRFQFQRARHRLLYDDFLSLQLALALKRQGLVHRPALPVPVTKKIDERIRQRFPFRLTADQEKVLVDVQRDLAREHPMYRLLQGDVGSGKTVIAFYALLAAVAQKKQAALMAPTEALAQQHFSNFDAMLQGSQVRRALLMGSLKAARRKEIVQDLSDGNIDVVIGTHALISRDVDFANLAVVIIDEQHKFGVKQRSVFRQRAQVPHELVMTATPIPRSLSMTWFGDMDISLLREKPPGRHEPLTKIVPYGRRAEVYRYVRRQIQQGGQAYIVCPRIEDNPGQELASVEKLTRALSQGPLRDVPLATLHRRLPAEQKSDILRQFHQGDLSILVSTVMVEVGIDVANAHVMVIENANRFGLSQLHQLRGRVGRGEKQGVCLLLEGKPNPNDPDYQDGSGFTPDLWEKSRLEILTDTSDGFEIAERDAEMRGIGQVIGDRQHGFFQPRLGDYLIDRPILEQARRDAQEILAQDPNLSSPDWQAMRLFILEQYAEQLELALVG